MTNDSFFPGLAAAVRSVICWCSFFWLFSMIENNEVHGIRLLPFLAAGVACYMLCRGFLRVPRSIPALVGFAAAVTVVVSGLLMWKCSDLSGFWWSVFSVTAGLTIPCIYCSVYLSARKAPPLSAGGLLAVRCLAGYFVSC